jgi:hypothetical protein
MAPAEAPRARRVPAREALDVALSTLSAQGPAFTRGNLRHAVRRLSGATTDAAFAAALRRRRAAGAIPGLLPDRPRWDAWQLGLEEGARFPAAVVLVDRPTVADLFVAWGVCRARGLAAVALDGTPPRLVEHLRRGFQEGLRAPVLYLHDAATVVYPFTIEPLASLVAQPGDEPVPYQDLGLPPLGASPGRFDDASLPDEERVVELEALPPATLVRYALERAARFADVRARPDLRRAPSR